MFRSILAPALAGALVLFPATAPAAESTATKPEATIVFHQVDLAKVKRTDGSFKPRAHEIEAPPVTVSLHQRLDADGQAEIYCDGGEPGHAEHAVPATQESER